MRGDWNRQWMTQMLVASGLLANGCYQGQSFSREENALPAGSGGVVEDTEGETGSDGGGGTPDGELDCDVEAQWTSNMLADRCDGCHGPGSNGAGGFDYIDDLTRLVTSGLIVPGDPDGSPIYARAAAGTMPPAGPEVPVDDIVRLDDFISSCADNPQAQCQDNQSPDYYEQLAMVATDIVSVDLDDRPFTRYLSLAHRHAAGFCEDELDIYRDALSKTLNVLSDQPTLALPEPIDAQELIYRIDLRDYGWDEPMGEHEDKWAAVVASNPYAVERLEDDAETIKILTGAQIPLLMADAFIEAVTRPPLYYALADIPASRGELETRLGVDLAADVEALDVVRAGVVEGSMAPNNRVVERHDLPNGAGSSLWLGYEVADDALEANNVHASPLSFEPTMQTIIFSLPNGLHAYAMVDGSGDRIDVAPDDVLVDPSQFDGNMRAGVSCFRCHDGIVAATDVVREHVLGGVDFDAQTKDAVSQIYPTVATFAQFVDQDNARYGDALAGAGLQPGGAVEPISEAAARFDLNVDLAQAAAELGIDETTLLTQLGGLEPTLSPLANGVIKREVWTSRFPEVVCALNLGRSPSGSCGPGGSQSYGPCQTDADCNASETCVSTSDGAVCAPGPCLQNTDCPDAAGAEPACSAALIGRCILPCQDDQTCPNDMTCSASDFCIF